MNQYLFFIKGEMKEDKIEVGDWVHVRIVGFGSAELPYKVESIEGDIYAIVQEEGSYKHILKVKKNQIKKL